ncbi:MAG: glycosyltransferase family 39 protein [Candidatus Omnitrophica bacterium]|nr:glycosyltransferase family 39 protein [Candidatus Omnitrophota bacterium]
MKDKIFEWRWIILSLIFWFIVISNIPGEFLDLGGDSAQYIILSESLIKGSGYRAINYPEQPFFYSYPPLFSLLLLPIIYFFGRNFYLMHILIVFLGYLSLLFFYHLFKKYSDSKQAAIATIFLATSKFFIFYSTQHILSDIPYLFCSSLTLLAVSEYLEKDNSLNKEGIFTLIGLLLCYFTRYVGVTLFLGVLVALLLTPHKARFKKISFISIGFLLPFLSWQLAAKILNPSSATSYANLFLLADPYKPFLGTIFTNPRYLFLRLTRGVSSYYSVIGLSFFFYFIKRWQIFAGAASLISLILLFLGVRFKFRQNKTCVFHYYFLLYIFFIIFWHFYNLGEAMRYVLPILPFMIFYFFTALKKILSYLPQKISFFAFCSLLSALFIFNILALPIEKNTYQNLSPHLKSFISLHRWMKENLPKGGTIISRKPTVTYLYTNHKAICFPYTSNPEQIWSEVLKNNIEYIIVDEISPETYDYLLPFLYEYKDKFKLLKAIEKTGLFEVIKAMPKKP